MKKNAFVGMVGLAALTGAAVVMGQQGNQPGQTQPNRPTTPGQVERQPGQMGRQPGMQGGSESQQAVQFARKVAQHTEKMSQELKQTNERLRQQLDQARNVEGEQQVTQLIEVIDGILQEHDKMAEHATKLNAMAIQHELKTAKVEQSQIQQLEQEYAFLQEAGDDTLRAIPQPDLEEDDTPLRPGSPTGPR